MRLKNSYFFTLREDVKDEDSTSGNLLVRSGMVKKTSSGVYMFLPLGFLVLQNVEKIIREEMNNIDSQELLMPSLIPTDVFEQSGRFDAFGSSLFTLKDRDHKQYALGPTHEELFAVAAKMNIKSYKDLPISLYQIQNKFRDEKRARFGLIRVKEFLMKDAYTFDKSLSDLDESYNKMFNAYKRIFDRLGINYEIVKADTGAMGGLLSEEFQAVSDIGEDILVLSEDKTYASNLEIAEVITNYENNDVEKTLEKVHTPNMKTIEEVHNFLSIEPINLIKTIIYNVDGELFALSVPGNREINETKVTKLLKAINLELANEDEVQNNTNTVVGFVGPKDLNIKVILDKEILKMKNFVIGANELDYHLINVNIKDLNYDEVADISNVIPGDLSPSGSPLYFKKGIEIGNTFKLGDKYANAFNVKYSDENNELQTVYMGSYGIGPGRIIAALAEQNNDEFGLIWPNNVAPYQVAIVNLNDEYQHLGEQLYAELQQVGISVLIDDRDERAGVKFKDLDLIGIPYRIVVGKDASEGMLEVKSRKDNDVLKVEFDDIVKHLLEKMDK